GGVGAVRDAGRGGGARAAAGAGPAADGVVVRKRTVADEGGDEAGKAVIHALDAAAVPHPAVPPGAAGAADGLVVDENAVGDEERRVTERAVDPTAAAGAAIGPGTAGAADGLVVDEGAVADGGAGVLGGEDPTAPAVGTRDA